MHGRDNVVADLQRAIDDRNDSVDAIGLFDKIREHNAEEAKLAGLVKEANALARVAADKQGLAARLAMADQVPDADKANARADARRAVEAANAARRRWQDQANRVLGLQQQILPHLKKWLECYARMRQAFVPDRRDPNRQAVLQVLERAIANRRDFFEGRVLAALAHAFDGNVAKADAHLDAASRDISDLNMLLTQIADDCCHGCLLIGKPGKVDGFVTFLKRLNPQRQTVGRCWLVALHGFITGRENDAALYFQKALAKVNVFADKDPVPPEAAPLLGDAALLRLAAANEAQRNAEKARQILGRANPGWDAWQLFRARAALASEEKKWDEAVAHVDRCLDSCPGTLKDEVQAQRAAYVAKQPWVRAKPVKVAAIR